MAAQLLHGPCTLDPAGSWFMVRSNVEPLELLPSQLHKYLSGPAACCISGSSTQAMLCCCSALTSLAFLPASLVTTTLGLPAEHWTRHAAGTVSRRVKKSLVWLNWCEEQVQQCTSSMGCDRLFRSD